MTKTKSKEVLVSACDEGVLGCWIRAAAFWMEDLARVALSRWRFLLFSPYYYFLPSAIRDTFCLSYATSKRPSKNMVSLVWLEEFYNMSSVLLLLWDVLDLTAWSFRPGVSLRSNHGSANDTRESVSGRSIADRIDLPPSPRPYFRNVYQVEPRGSAFLFLLSMYLCTCYVREGLHSTWEHEGRRRKRIRGTRSHECNVVSGYTLSIAESHESKKNSCKFFLLLGLVPFFLSRRHSTATTICDTTFSSYGMGTT